MGPWERCGKHTAGRPAQRTPLRHSKLSPHCLTGQPRLDPARLPHRYRCRYYKGGGRGRYFLRAKAAAAIFKGQGCGRYFLRAKAAAAIFKGQGCVRYFLRVKAATFISGCYFRPFFVCKLHFVFVEASTVLGRTSVELRRNFGGTSAELRRNFGGTFPCHVSVFFSACALAVPVYTAAARARHRLPNVPQHVTHHVTHTGSSK